MSNWDPSDIFSGWFLVNDADAVIRGAIIGATGTFSGEVTADSVNAVKSLNIRDGAVSTNLGFTYPSPPHLGITELIFRVPGQDFAQAINMTVPIYCTLAGNVGYSNVTLQVYRNGVLLWSQVWDSVMISGFTKGYLFQWYASLRFLDLNVPATGDKVDYRFVILENPGNVTMRGHFYGSAHVSMRKR